MRHPESFRKTLAQIANDAQFAFVIAHHNMIKIQLEMDLVPDYVEDSIEIIQNRPSFPRLLGIQTLIEIRFDDSTGKNENNSRQRPEIVDRSVSDFPSIIEQLIEQVMLAITASHGAKQQENCKCHSCKNKESQRQPRISCWPFGRHTERGSTQETSIGRSSPIWGWRCFRIAPWYFL